MPRDRFVDMVEDAILSLPQDVKLVLRVLEDPEVDDEGHIAAAGALLHVLSASNAIPGMRGVLAYVDDALVMRLVLERIEKSNPEAMAQQREAFPEFFGRMDEQLEVARDHLGELMTVLDTAAARVGKLSHQGHAARGCGTDPDESNWLYDAVQEALVDRLELDEDEVRREVRNVDAIVPALRTRVGGKP